MELGSPLIAQSSVYGKINQLLLVYPNDPSKVSRETILQEYEDLFINFGDRVTFVILSNYEHDLNNNEFLEVRDRFAQAFREALFDSHLHPEHHLIHIPAPMTVPWAQTRGRNTHHNHSDFIQDPFVVMKNRLGESALMESFRSLNPKNQYVAEQVGAATGMLVRPTEAWVEGGNILVGNDFALVGMNLLYHNREILFPGKELLEKIGGSTAYAGLSVKDALTGMFKRLLGVRYLRWVGVEDPMSLNMEVDQGKYGLQPFFHLDHYITLAGMTDDGDELVLVGSIDTDYVDGPVELYKEDLMKLNGMLNEVENQLRRSGTTEPGPRFEFRKLPMGGKLVEKGKGHKFIPYSYNNCHVEWYHGVKRLYMPKYPQTAGLEEEILREMVGKKFPPFKFINYGLEHYAESGGSLHCLTKVLKRSNFWF